MSKRWSWAYKDPRGKIEVAKEQEWTSSFMEKGWRCILLNTSLAIFVHERPGRDDFVWIWVREQ
jgi:hypothetical protein